MQKPTKEEKAAAKQVAQWWGRQGGKKRARTLSPERLSEIGKKAAKARWDKVALDKPTPTL